MLFPSQSEVIYKNVNSIFLPPPPLLPLHPSNREKSCHKGWDTPCMSVPGHQASRGGIILLHTVPPSPLHPPLTDTVNSSPFTCELMQSYSVWHNIINYPVQSSNRSGRWFIQGLWISKWQKQIEFRSPKSHCVGCRVMDEGIGRSGSCYSFNECIEHLLTTCQVLF